MTFWVYSALGAIPFTWMTFPDGQRHCTLELREARAEALAGATIEARIATVDDLFDVLLVKDVLDANGFQTNLDIRYLLGARMDRRIDHRQPHTLQIVARLIRQAGFRRIRVLDPHSIATTALLGAEPVYPVAAVDQVLQEYDPVRTLVVAPDLGASERVGRLVNLRFPIVQGLKHRDTQSGRLSGFEVRDGSQVKGRRCLILDDICDGGGTFVGLGEKLRDLGASAVDLFVTHGLFTKGLPLDGIDKLFTTDSYTDPHLSHAVVIPVRMRDAQEICR